MALEKEIAINVPAEQVFAYVADVPRHPEWAQHDLKIERTSEGPVEEGSTFTSTGHQLGRDNHDRITVTEYAPGERFVFECEGDAGRIRHWFTVQTVNGGTRLTKGAEAVERRFPFSVLYPVVRAFVLPGAIAGDLRRIKERLEGGGN